MELYTIHTTASANHNICLIMDNSHFNY